MPWSVDLMVRVKLVSVFRVVTKAEIGRPVESVVVPRSTPVVACACALSRDGVRKIATAANSIVRCRSCVVETARRFMRELRNEGGWVARLLSLLLVHLT